MSDPVANLPPSYDHVLNEKQEEPMSSQPPVSFQSSNEYPRTYNPPPQTNVGSGFDNIVYKPAENANAPPPPAAMIQDEETSGFTVRGSFSDMDVRRLYIRKVFLTLGLQLLFTFGIVCLFFFEKSVHYFVQRNAGVYYAAYAVFFVMYIVLVCAVNAVRNHPWNLIMLAALTVSLSYMVGTIATFYTYYAVVIGMGVTVGVCTMVILFSMQTKFDFTQCAGLLFVLGMVLFFFGFVTIFTYHYSWYLQVVYGSLGALFFTLFLAFDTQLVMGGRKYELDPEEYIFGALILYIDVIYIFLFILTIFGGSSK